MALDVVLFLALLTAGPLIAWYVESKTAELVVDDGRFIWVGDEITSTESTALVINKRGDGEILEIWYMKRKCTY